MVTVLFSAALALSMPVSLEIEVSRLAVAVPKLEAATQMKLRVEEPAASEVVFISAKDRPVQEILDRVAEVACASWVRADDGALVLRRSAGQVAEEEAKEKAAWAAAIETWRKEAGESLALPYDAKSVSSRFRSSSSSGTRTMGDIVPRYRLLSRLSLMIPVSELLAMRVGDALSYGTRPDGAKRTLGKSGEELLLITEQEEKTYSEGRKLAGMEEWEDEEQFTEETKETNLSLRIFRTAETIRVFSTRTYKRGTATGSEGNGSFIHLYNQPEEDRLVVQFDTPKRAPETQALGLLLARGGTKGRASVELIRNFLISAKEHDPLWIGNNEVLRAAAQQIQEPIIACLSDGDFPNDEPPNPFTAQRLTTVDSDGWIQIRPKLYASHWRDRVSRDLIERCAKEFEASGKISVETFLSGGSIDDRGPAARLLQLIDPHASELDGSFAFSEVPILLYRSLSSEQLSRLLKGETLPFESLTVQQGHWVDLLSEELRLGQVEVPKVVRRGLSLTKREREATIFLDLADDGRNCTTWLGDAGIRLDAHASGPVSGTSFLRYQAAKIDEIRLVVTHSADEISAHLITTPARRQGPILKWAELSSDLQKKLKPTLDGFSEPSQGGPPDPP